ncbi:MAG: hypothetical protein ACLFR0_05530 [Alphaproteobacteria bacterium]
MGTKNTEVKVDKKELDRAEHMWGAFTEATKWSIIGITAILILLAIIFL